MSCAGTCASRSERLRSRRRPAQFAPHLPAHPQQQYAAGQQQADNRQQLDRNRSEGQTQHRRHDDADQDGARPAFGRQAGGGKTDDDRIVAGQHQVDHDDLEQCGDMRLE